MKYVFAALEMRVQSLPRPSLPELFSWYKPTHVELKYRCAQCLPSIVTPKFSAENRKRSQNNILAARQHMVLFLRSCFESSNNASS